MANDNRNAAMGDEQANVPNGSKQAQQGRGNQNQGNQLGGAEPTDTLEDRNLSGADTWRTLPIDQNQQGSDGSDEENR
jgi:hypothetical protein